MPISLSKCWKVIYAHTLNKIFHCHCRIGAPVFLGLQWQCTLQVYLVKIVAIINRVNGLDVLFCLEHLKFLKWYWKQLNHFILIITEIKSAKCIKIVISRAIILLMPSFTHDQNLWIGSQYYLILCGYIIILLFISLIWKGVSSC